MSKVYIVEIDMFDNQSVIDGTKRLQDYINQGYVVDKVYKFGMDMHKYAIYLFIPNDI